MEIKESVDILEMLLGARGRDVTAEELSRCGSLLLDRAREVLDADGNIDEEVREELKRELSRALECLERSGGKLRGRAKKVADEIRVEVEGIFRCMLAKESATPGGSAEARDVLETDVGGEAQERASEGDMGVGDKSLGVSLELRPESTPAVSLGERLREKRLKLKLRQRELAKRLGISVAYLSLLENGKCSRPSAEVTERILSFLEGCEMPVPVGVETGETVGAGSGQVSSDERPKRKSTQAGNRATLMKRLLRSALQMKDEDLEVLVRTAEFLLDGTPGEVEE